jgi:hypothetical protein
MTLNGVKWGQNAPRRVPYDRPRPDGHFDMRHAMVATIFIFGDRSVTGSVTENEILSYRDVPYLKTTGSMSRMRIFKKK